MKHSITTVHIERMRCLYNDHDEHSVNIGNFFQKQLCLRSRHVPITKNILLLIVALANGFVDLHNEVCKGLILVSTINFSLINNFRVITFDMNGCDALLHSVQKRKLRSYRAPLCTDHIVRDWNRACDEVCHASTIQRSFMRALH